ncbi:MAG: beta-propeller domain-containing protein [Myxococcales bacterium]|nr:beta-propeller domain-containing protein [Myxococcales bacterium]
MVAARKRSVWVVIGVLAGLLACDDGGSSKAGSGAQGQGTERTPKGPVPSPSNTDEPAATDRDPADDQGTAGRPDGEDGSSEGSDKDDKQSPEGPQPAGPMGMDHQLVPSEQEVELAPLDGVVFPELGASEFETAIAESGSVVRGTGTRAANPFGNGAVAETTPFATLAAAPAMNAPMDVGDLDATAQTAAGAMPSAVQREIVEADIVQMEGDVLYVLNRFRGLVLIDMSDPDAPFIAGRVPFQAVPVDMYLREGRAYVVMSDYFAYWQWDDDADPLGFHGSRVLVVDVNDPTAPEEMGGFSVEGEVTDSRIVGDVLYLVSHRDPQYWRYDTYEWEDTTWVLSIDISDPTDIKEVDREEFTGAGHTIQVYTSGISVAATDPNYYIVDEQNARQTLITYLDISDPAGDIHVGGSAYVEGVVADKFKMDMHDGHLRVIAQDWYWRANEPAKLHVFDVSDVDDLDKVGEVAISGDNGLDDRYTRPQGTRFAGDKLFISLCWNEQRLSLWVPVCRMDFYDLATPSNPGRAGSLPIDGGITHFEVRGDRLISLGNNNILDLNRAWRTRVQVGLYDISSLSSIRELSTTDLGEFSSNTNARADYKAFKVLEDEGMILLPLSWRVIEGRDPFGRDIIRGYNGAQIVDWQGDTLAARGRIEHHDSVRRVISFKDRVVVVSQRQLRVVDAQDRDDPETTAQMFLVRNVVDAFEIQDYQVQLGFDEEDSSFRFFVLPFGEDDMAESLAELPIDYHMYMRLRSGDIIRMIGYDRVNQRQVIRNADFSDPLSPRWRGEYVIPQEIQHIWGGGRYYGYWGYYDYYWNRSAGQPLNNDYLPATIREVGTDQSGRRFFKNFLRVIDLTDPDNPRLADGSIEMPDWPFVNQVTHGTVLMSVHTEPALDEDGNPKQFHERYFLDRVDVSDPDSFAQLPSMNIPGRLVDVDESGEVLYTVDYQWDEHGRRRNSLNVLHIEGDEAVLKAVLPVGDEIGRARYLDREIWLASHKYPWWGRNAETPDSRQPYTRLSRVTIEEDGELASDEHLDIWGYHFNLLDIEGQTAILATHYPTGLLVVDASDLENAEIVSAARTVGYVSKVVPHEGYLYMPMGSYGVRRVAY